MQDKVVKIANVSFLSSFDKTVITKIFNSDFEINDDFSGNRSKLSFDELSSTSSVEEGIIVNSNYLSSVVSPIKIYLSKYRKNSCDWDNIIFYGILENYDQTTEMNKWELLYVNEQYCVYRYFSQQIPNSFPLDGNIPPNSIAPFIKYESFKNIWIRKEGRFKYENSIISLVNEKGDSQWKMITSGDDECVFTYTKNTPFGCDLTVPNVDSIIIPEECSRIIESSSSISSESSASTEQNSTESSKSSDSSSSSESSSLNSSSSEERLYPKNISTIYLRIIGQPFVESQYVLSLQNPNVFPLVWSSNSHNAEMLTTGMVSVSMNSSGRFFVSVDAVINNSPIVINNALLSNVRNDNFGSYVGYLKGLGVVNEEYITTKYSINNSQIVRYDCIISYETMERNSGAPKKLSEIIYDYELSELTIEEDASKVILYLGRANSDNMINNSDVCRAWGLFCLNYIEDGYWEYKNDDQIISLEKTDSGGLTIYRKYLNSSTDSEEIYLDIDPKTITTNITGAYSGFAGSAIVPRFFIRNGIEIANQNDVCNATNTVVALYSADNCSQNVSYSPYNGNLALTISGGGWNGKKSYILKPNIINGNLAVWNWSNEGKVNDFEYVTLFSQDGILWKLTIYRNKSGSKDYIVTEFIKENTSSNNFSSIFQKLHKSFLSINGSWGTEEATITISKV